MSGTSLYDLVIPTFIKGLQTFDHILSKAEEHAEKNGLDANQIFPQARLVDDQLPLTFQVQNATKIVQVTVGRLTGVDSNPFENNEQTVEDLHKRIGKALDLLKAVKPVDVDSREDVLIDLPWGGKTHQVTVKAAVFGHAQTNFFFHLVTGYSILRAQGVPIGKVDYLTNFLGL